MSNKERKSSNRKLEYMKAYRSRPEVVKKKSEYDKEYYLKHRDARSKAMMERYSKRKAMIDAVAIHYGCQNPGCQWEGDYEPCELDFHHIADKDIEIGKIYLSSLKRLAIEINKCLVLCRNCHARYHRGLFILDTPRRCEVTIEDNTIVPK